MTSLMILAFQPQPASRDYDVVMLPGVTLGRVVRADPAIAPHIDARWAVSEVLLVRAREDAEPWQRRMAKELAEKLAEATNGTVRDVVLDGEPALVPASPPRRAVALDAVDELVGWLDEIQRAGEIVDARVLEALRRRHGLPNDARIVVARARAKPDDLSALEEEVNERCGLTLPPLWARLVSVVGGARLEVLTPDGKQPLPDVLLPVRGVRALYADFADPMAGYLPFFRDREGTFVIDLEDGESVAWLSAEDPSPESDAVSLSRWLLRWRQGGMVAKRHPAPSPPRLTTRAGVERWWRMTAKWVQPMYASPPGEHEGW